jgi:hypothetical protein
MAGIPVDKVIIRRLTAIALPVLLVTGSCGSNIQFITSPVDAHITYFVPAAETYYPGEAVTSSLRLKNTGKEPWSFWIGYSVHDQAEQWYDIVPHLVALDPTVEFEVESKTWLPACQRLLSNL